jgi:hypothetical protein
MFASRPLSTKTTVEYGLQGRPRKMCCAAESAVILQSFKYKTAFFRRAVPALRRQKHHRMSLGVDFTSIGESLRISENEIHIPFDLAIRKILARRDARSLLGRAGFAAHIERVLEAGHAHVPEYGAVSRDHQRHRLRALGRQFFSGAEIIRESNPARHKIIPQMDTVADTQVPPTWPWLRSNTIVTWEESPAPSNRTRGFVTGTTSWYTPGRIRMISPSSGSTSTACCTVRKSPEPSAATLTVFRARAPGAESGQVQRKSTKRRMR